MNKIVSLVAIALAFAFTSHSMAQCIGCSNGVTPTFNQPVYAAPSYGTVVGAPMYNSGPVYSASPVCCSQPAYAPCCRRTCCRRCCQTYCARSACVQQTYCCRQPVCNSCSQTTGYAPMYGQPVSGCVGCSSGTVQPMFGGEPMIENPATTVPPVVDQTKADEAIPPVPTPTPDNDGT